MSETVNLPALGESVTEGTVTRWLKEVGDEVAVDEPLVEVSTDKVDTEVPSPVAGVIEKILVEEDEDVEVGAPLVVIGDGSGSGDSDSDSGSDESAEDEAGDESKDTAEESDSSAEADDAAQDEPTESAPKKSSGGSGTEVTLPALGESVTEGTVTRWLKEVGEEVEVDEPLLEVSTDKVDTEVPSPVAGTLLEIKVQEDEDAEVGQVLALIGDADAAGSSDDESDDSQDAEATADSSESTDSEDSQGSAEEIEDAATSSSTPEATDEAADEKASSETKDSAKDDSQEEAAPAQTEAPKKAEETKESSGGGAAQSSGDSSSAYVTPLVRKLAKDKGVDLGSVKGTGVGGRIRKQDVLAAAESAPASSGSGGSASLVSDNGEPTTILPVSDKRGTTEKAPRIRMTIAKRMRESLQESAQLTQVTEVDMTRVAGLRNKAKNAFQEKHGAKLTFLPFFAQAVAEALKANPALNCTFKEDQKEIVYNGSEDLAIAVDTPRGLLVPVIRNAGDMQLPGLASSIADLGARAKDGSIGPDELTGGTFTITNIGSFGALFDTPIINQPQVAILGTGTIVKRPMVIQDADGNDVIAIRHMCYLSLTYDHRIVDGADAGRFLQAMKARLEEGRFEGALEL